MTCIQKEFCNCDKLHPRFPGGLGDPPETAFGLHLTGTLLSCIWICAFHRVALRFT